MATRQDPRPVRFPIKHKRDKVFYWGNQLNSADIEIDGVYLLASSQQQRQAAAGLLLAEAFQWADEFSDLGAPPVDHLKQSELYDLGMRLLNMQAIEFGTSVTQSTDGLFHLTWEINYTATPAQIVLHLETPPGSGIAGVQVTTLAAGSQATASLDSSNILHLGIPRGDPGTNGTNGSNGSNGQTPELRNSGTALQWRYVGQTDWIDLVQLSDLRGPQGLQGQAGPQGLQGIQGIQGVPGNSYVPSNGTQDANGLNECGAAEKIATTLYQMFQDLQAKQNADATTVGLAAAILQLVGTVSVELGIGFAVEVGAAVTQLISATQAHSTASNLSAWNNAAQDKFTSALYCCLSNAGTINMTEDLRQVWISNIGNYTDADLSLQAKTLMIDLVTIQPLGLLKQAGIVGSYNASHDCDSYNCGSSNAAWAYTFDFTQSDHAWVASYWGTNTQDTRAVYQAGIGWGPRAGYNAFHIAFPKGTVITKVEIWRNFRPANGRNFMIYRQQTNGVVVTQYGTDTYDTPSGLYHCVITGNMVFPQNADYFECFGDTTSYIGQVTKIIMYGTGTCPFTT